MTRYTTGKYDAQYWAMLKFGYTLIPSRGSVRDQSHILEKTTNPGVETDHRSRSWLRWKKCLMQKAVWWETITYGLEGRASSQGHTSYPTKLCASEKGASHASFYIAISYNIRSAYLVLLRNEDREFLCNKLRTTYECFASVTLKTGCNLLVLTSNAALIKLAKFVG
jgi:hypothetical protein